VSVATADKQSAVSKVPKDKSRDKESQDELYKKVELAQNQATAPLKDYISSALKQAESDLLSRVSDNMPEPFDMRVNKDGKWSLSLPANSEAIDRLLTRQILHFCANLGVLLVGTTQTVNMTKETDSEKDYFFGFFKILTRQPIEDEKFTFNFDSTSAKGAAQCKLLILQRTLKGKYVDVQQFLPPSLFTDRGARRIEVEISAIAGGQKANLQRIPQCLSKIVELWLETDNGKAWSSLAVQYKIALPVVIEGLHKRVTEKVKGKDIVHIKKPKRPSKRIEVLSALEKKLIASFEKPFDDYKKTLKDLGNEISIGKIKGVRDVIRQHIHDMWAVVERFSAPLTKRRTALIAHLSENERKKLNFNKSFIDKLRADHFGNVIYGGDAATIYTLSPIPILAKCGSEFIVEANKITIKTSFIYYDPGLKTDVEELLLDFCRIVNVKVTNKVTERSQRKTHHGPTAIRGGRSGKLVFQDDFNEEVDEEDDKTEGDQ
jgi:hypothetical protein